MPCIWGQISNSQLLCGATVFPVGSGVGSLPIGSHFSGLIVGAYALIDTGATMTCITSRLAAQVGLQPIGKVQVHGVGGMVSHNSYLFHVGFPFTVPPGATLPPAAPGQSPVQVHVLHKVIRGCEFHGGSAPQFDILLGMDVIETGLLTAGNDGFCFAF